MRPNAIEPVAGGGESVRWTAADAREWLTPPTETDDKYSRGVLGFATGSVAYPGAAVIGVDAALHTGVGMVRYLGPESVDSLVLGRRPEAVLGDGRVNAWVVGSGMAADDAEARARIDAALALGAPAIVDAGAIGMVLAGPAILTPHAGELARLLRVERSAVEADPIAAAQRAARERGAVVLLKGSTTLVTDGPRVAAVAEATPWLATAGAGDALAGILGALVATRGARGPIGPAELVPLGATAAFIHGRAARLASGGGPFTILGLVARVPEVIRELLLG